MVPGLPTRTRRRTAVAMTGVMLLTVTPSPATGGLLDDLVGGVVDGVLNPVLGVVEDVLAPLLGASAPLDLQIELDTPVDGLVEEALAPLTDTVGQVLDDPRQLPTLPGAPGRDATISPLAGLEVLDGVVEDVAAPAVLAPLGDAVAPVVGRTRPVMQPLGPVVDRALDVTYLSLSQLVAATLDEAAAYRAVVTTAEGATVVRDGVVDVPTALDVTGDGVQDLTVEMRVVTARPSLRVTRLPGAPTDLPVRVEAVLSPGGDQRLAVGFDALDATLPDVVRATLTDGAAGGDALGVELHAVGASDALAVVAGQFTAGPDGPVDPAETSIRFAPVPVDVTASVAGLGGGGSLDFDLTTSQPSRVDAAFRTATGSDTTELGATIDRVPGHVSASVSQAGPGVDVDYRASGPVDHLRLTQAATTPDRARSVAVSLEGLAAEEASLRLDPDDLLGYAASAPIDALGLEVHDTAGVIDRATALRARLVGLPTDLDVDLGDERVVLDANGGSLGLVEVLATSGPDLLPAADTDGLVLRDTTEHYVVGARLTTLRSLDATLADDGLDAELRTAGGRPFVVDVETDGTGIAAHVDALPATTRVALTGDTLTWQADAVAGLTAELTQGTATTALAVAQLPTDLAVTMGDDGSLVWQADRPTPSLELERTDPAGVLDRATSLQVRITDLPTQVSLATAGGGAELVAGDPVGAIELLATSGPEVSLPTGAQGVVLRDAATGYALALRLLGIRELGFSPDPATLHLLTDGARPVTVDVHTVADGTTTDLQAELADLPQGARITLDDQGDGIVLDYEAVAPMASLVASLTRTDADGSVRTVALDVTDLPASARLSATDQALAIDGDSGITSLAVDATDDAGLLDRATRLALRATDLPPALSVELDGEAPSLHVPTGSIGEVELLLTDGDELTVAGGADGIVVRDEADRFVVAARLTGLRGLALTGAATGFELATDGGRTFVLDAVLPSGDGTTTVLAELVDLPTTVALELDEVSGPLGLAWAASDTLARLTAELVSSGPDQDDVVTRLEAVDLPTNLAIGLDDTGGVTYAADAVLPRLDVELHDPAGVIGEATDARLHVEDLPTELTMAFTDDGASLVADGGTVGLLELLVTSGPDEVLPDGVQGLRLRDTADGMVVAARITDLGELGYTAVGGGTDLTLATGGGATFVVDVLVEDAAGAGSQAIAAELAPLPSSVTLGLAEQDGARQLTWSADQVMEALDATVTLVDADGTSQFALGARDLPTSLSLDLAEAGVIAYQASGPLSRLEVSGRDPDGIFAAATALEAVLTDLPTAATVALGDDGALSLSTEGGRLGSLEARAVSADGVPVGLADGVDGIALLDEPGQFGAHLRLTDVDTVALATAPVALTLGTAGGATFVVDAALREGGSLDTGLGDTELHAVLDPLPADLTVEVADTPAGQALSLDGSAAIHQVALSLVQADAAGGAPLSADVVITDAAPQLALTLDPSGGVAYAASRAVPLLSIDAFDADGLFDRAGELRLRLEDLPASLDLGLSDSGSITIDTTGGALGLLEAQATTGPDVRLPAGNDGVLLEDLADRLVVFARFTALASVEVTQDPLPAVDLVAGGQRPLEIRLFEAAPGKASPVPGTEFTTAVLAPAPPQVDLALLDGQPGQLNIAYQASHTAAGLSFETNAGDRWLTSASISDPVPTSFTACQAGDRSCVGETGDGNVGSLAFVANQHTTLNVFDCTRPLNSSCRPGGSPSEYLHVDDLRVRTLRFTGHVTGSTTQSGNLFFDTDRHQLTGRVVQDSPDQQFELSFGSGFWAQDRRGTFRNYPLPGWLGGSYSATGSITCGPFSFEVTVLGFITISAKRLLGC